jgi:hypothetical protein
MKLRLKWSLRRIESSTLDSRRKFMIGVSALSVNIDYIWKIKNMIMLRERLLYRLMCRKYVCRSFVVGGQVREQKRSF